MTEVVYDPCIPNIGRGLTLVQTLVLDAKQVSAARLPIRIGRLQLASSTIEIGAVLCLQQGGLHYTLLGHPGYVQDLSETEKPGTVIRPVSGMLALLAARWPSEWDPGFPPETLKLLPDPPRTSPVKKKKDDTEYIPEELRAVLFAEARPLPVVSA